MSSFFKKHLGYFLFGDFWENSVLVCCTEWDQSVSWESFDYRQKSEGEEGIY